MAIYTKVSGVWKEVVQPSVKVSGAWKNCSEVHVKVSGVWKKVWEALSYIAVAHYDSPCFTLLKRSGDSVSLASTYTLPGAGYGCSFWESS